MNIVDRNAERTGARRELTRRLAEMLVDDVLKNPDGIIAQESPSTPPAPGNTGNKPGNKPEPNRPT